MAKREKTYTTTEQARTGTWEMSVRFYSLPDGGGSLVGVAQSLVTLKSDGNLVIYDGQQWGRIQQGEQPGGAVWNSGTWGNPGAFLPVRPSTA